MNSSWKFVMEFFGWRHIKNRRELGSLSDLPRLLMIVGVVNGNRGSAKQETNVFEHWLLRWPGYGSGFNLKASSVGGL